MDDRQIILTGDDGKEFVFDILFTFDDEKGNQFVPVTDPEDEEGNVYAFRYDDEGELYEVDDPEQAEMCAEVLSAFVSEEEEADGEA